MKIDKLYTFSTKNKIWRILPAGKQMMVIETRNKDSKEAFFNCIKISSGEYILKDFQFEEKHWIGIEAVTEDHIYFHRFVRPDMPGHSGITAFRISDKTIVWENDTYSFLFLKDQSVITYRNKFEGKEFFELDAFTGELISALGDDYLKVNELKKKEVNESSGEEYYFPLVNNKENPQPVLADFFMQQRKTEPVTGRIEYIEAYDLLFFSYYVVADNGLLTCLFKAIDIKDRKIIFEEKLNENLKFPVPDLFFIKDRTMFLLKNDTDMIVCSIS